MHTFKLLALSILATGLMACGGGSSSSSDSSGKPSGTTTTNNNVKISASCAENNGTVSIIPTGCLFTSGNNQQSATCSGSSIKLLSGTGHTLADVQSKGSTLSGGGGVTINGKKLTCTA